MTTIASDKRFLVADSQVTSGGRVSLMPAKKIHFPEDHEKWTIFGKPVFCFGLTGTLNDFPFVKEWLEKGLTHRCDMELKDIGFTCLIVDHEGTVYRWTYDHDSNDKNPIPIHRVYPCLGPVAIGSGGVIAEAIMSLGKTAKEALKATAKIDIYTGGELQIVELPQRKKETPAEQTAA